VHLRLRVFDALHAFGKLALSRQAARATAVTPALAASLLGDASAMLSCLAPATSAFCIFGADGYCWRA
jgi:hypothetical protein